MDAPTLAGHTAPVRTAAHDDAVPRELRQELEAAALLAERLRLNDTPLRSHLAKEVSGPNPHEALRAQK
eukprot:9111312-Heterocapsa_arctica.AAC.1